MINTWKEDDERITYGDLATKIDASIPEDIRGRLEYSGISILMQPGSRGRINDPLLPRNSDQIGERVDIIPSWEVGGSEGYLVKVHAVNNPRDDSTPTSHMVWSAKSFDARAVIALHLHVCRELASDGSYLDGVLGDIIDKTMEPIRAEQSEGISA